MARLSHSIYTYMILIYAMIRFLPLLTDADLEASECPMVARSWWLSGFFLNLACLSLWRDRRLGDPKTETSEFYVFFETIFVQLGSLGKPLVYSMVCSSVGNGRVPSSEKHLGVVSFAAPRPSMAL